MNEREFKLTDLLYRKFRTRGYSLVCARISCGKEFKIGDILISRNTSSRYGCHVKRYHKNCWESYYIDA